MAQIAKIDTLFMTQMAEKAYGSIRLCRHFSVFFLLAVVAYPGPGHNYLPRFSRVFHPRRGCQNLTSQSRTPLFLSVNWKK